MSMVVLMAVLRMMAVKVMHGDKGCLPKKKIAEKETLVHMGGRG